MYSKELEAMLQKKGIIPGDEIRITTRKKTYEGILIPRPEFGDKNALVLKLKSGYNIGIRLRIGDKVEKKGSKRETFTLPKAELKKTLGLPKVTVIATGGTIGSSIDYTTGGVTSLVSQEELLYQIPELNGIAQFEMLNLEKRMSEDFIYKDWQELARHVARALSGSHGVVITHGTDTLHYTSAALSFMLHGLTGPVVVTGSQRSPDRGSSDAFMNFICASNFAAKAEVAEGGVCMHANSSDSSCSFIRGTKVRKMHTTRRDAFRPVNTRPIARVGADGSIEYTGEYKKSWEQRIKLKVMPGYEPKVALVKFYPNCDPDIIEYYISKRYRGIIIEGTGMGHVPVKPREENYSWVRYIKRAVDAGVVVGMTSQCLNGRVNSNVYTNLRLVSRAGAIYCEDMLPEVALIKLGWLLGNYRRTEAATLLDKNIVGEITQRSEIDWFP